MSLSNRSRFNRPSDFHVIHPGLKSHSCQPGSGRVLWLPRRPPRCLTLETCTGDRTLYRALAQTYAVREDDERSIGPDLNEEALELQRVGVARGDADRIYQRL